MGQRLLQIPSLISQFPGPPHLQKNSQNICLSAATAREELPLEMKDFIFKSLPFLLRMSESSVTVEYFCYADYVKPSVGTWLFST